MTQWKSIVIYQCSQWFLSRVVYPYTATIWSLGHIHMQHKPTKIASVQQVEGTYLNMQFKGRVKHSMKSLGIPSDTWGGFWSSSVMRHLCVLFDLQSLPLSNISVPGSGVHKKPNKNSLEHLCLSHLVLLVECAEFGVDMSPTSNFPCLAMNKA